MKGKERGGSGRKVKKREQKRSEENLRSEGIVMIGVKHYV